MLLELIEQSVLSLTSGGSIRSAAHSLPGQSTRVSERGYDLPSLTFIYTIFFFQAEDGIRDADVNWSSDVCSSDLESSAYEPLAAKMRPTRLEDYVGQEHVVGVGTPLRRALEAGNLHSLIFWGPPGVGKTTLARSEERRVGKECSSRWSAYH